MRIISSFVLILLAFLTLWSAFQLFRIDRLIKKNHESIVYLKQKEQYCGHVSLETMLSNGVTITKKDSLNVLVEFTTDSFYCSKIVRFDSLLSYLKKHDLK